MLSHSREDLLFSGTKQRGEKKCRAKWLTVGIIVSLQDGQCNYLFKYIFCWKTSVFFSSVPTNILTRAFDVKKNDWPLLSSLNLHYFHFHSAAFRRYSEAIILRLAWIATKNVLLERIVFRFIAFTSRSEINFAMKSTQAMTRKVSWINLKSFFVVSCHTNISYLRIGLFWWVINNLLVI